MYDIGANYLVMEFIEGTPLAGPLSLDVALRHAVQLADALTAAHAKDASEVAHPLKDPQLAPATKQIVE